MPHQQEPPGAPGGGSGRRITPLTAAGVLLMLVAATGLITYAALTLPARLAAASGPPETFREAATRQAVAGPAPVEQAGDRSPARLAATAPAPTATPTFAVAIPSSQGTPTAEPSTGGLPLPGWAEPRYWLSIPRIGLEAGVIPFAPRAREVDGVPVSRLPVPNTFAAGWDETSAEPGFAGNTVMAGHNNLYGAVFAGLTELQPGDEISVWSEYGVFSYRVQQTLLLEEEGQPLEVRLQNAQWLADTPDDRLTLITCWPRETYTHRLIVVATR